MDLGIALLSVFLPLQLFFPLIITFVLIIIKKRQSLPIKKALAIGIALQIIWILGIVIIGLRGAASFLNTMG